MKISVAMSAVAALVLANAGLFVMVDAHSRGAVASTSAEPATSPPSSTAGSATQQTTSSGTQSGSSAGASVVGGGPRVFVVALSGTRAWRAVSSGGCTGSVRIVGTRDGGQTWNSVLTPPVGAVNGLSIDDQGRLAINGQQTSGCTAGTWSLAGGAWSSSSPSGWQRTGARSGDLAQGGHKVTACDQGWVVDLATAGKNADVLCSTGDVRTVTPGGTATTVYQSTSAISIGTTADNSLVVARSVGGCDGVELDEIAGGSPQRITCVKGASGAADLTFAGDQGWLVTATDTWTGGTSGSWAKS